VACNNLTAVDQKILEERERAKAAGRLPPLRVLFILRLTRKVLNFDDVLQAWIAARLRRVWACSDEPLTYYGIFDNGAGPVRYNCGERYVHLTTNRTVYLATAYFPSLLYDAQAHVVRAADVVYGMFGSELFWGVVMRQQTALVELMYWSMGKTPKGVNEGYVTTWRSEFSKVSVSAFLHHVAFHTRYPCADHALCNFGVDAFVFQAMIDAGMCATGRTLPEAKALCSEDLAQAQNRHQQEADDRFKAMGVKNKR